MPDDLTFKFSGTDELSRKFRELSDRARTEIALPAALDAMDIVLADAVDRASRIDDPATANDMSANLRKAEQSSVPGSIRVSVGMKRYRKNQKGGNTFYWWFVELGTMNQRPQPFMRNALYENRQAVFQEFISSAKFRLLERGL